MKPLVFIGSSSEGLVLAKAVQQEIQRETYPKVWTQGVFGPSSITIDALLEQVAQNDFGVFVMSPDDILNLRKVNYYAARDNVLFEGALFMGRYGRDRAFLLKPQGMPDFHIPTDLQGFAFAEYDANHAKIDARAAMGTPCTDILKAIAKAPNHFRDLKFSVNILRSPGANFPAKVWIIITNYGSRDVVLRANHFTYKSGLRRSANAIVSGNPDNKEFSFLFPAKGGHTQPTIMLRPREQTNVYVGVDPAHSDDEIDEAIKAKNIAILHLTCTWLEEGDVTIRSFAVEV